MTTAPPQSGDNNANSIQPDDPTNSVSSSFQSPLKNTTTTFQLINSFPNSGAQSSPTSLQQRINISNSSPSKNITTVSGPTLVQKLQSLTTTTTPSTANYKVLSQQLPQQQPQPQSIVIKPSSATTTNSNPNPNRIVITKTVSTIAPSSDDQKKPITNLSGKVADVIRAPTTQISLTPIANSANLNAIGKIKTAAFLNELEKVSLLNLHK